MSILIGSTGFVGGHLSQIYKFDYEINRTNSNDIAGLETDFLICAGLPAEKWRANQAPEDDWTNTIKLAALLQTVDARKAILISTIDVYQPALKVDESSAISLEGPQAYGRNRAWFEKSFLQEFPDSHVIRLPGLFSDQLRKNFIFDLRNNRNDQIVNVNSNSTFQFFNMENLKQIIDFVLDKKIKILNVATEPLIAQEIADLKSVTLSSSGTTVAYDMRSIHAKTYNDSDDYLYSKSEVLNDINELLNRDNE